MSDHSLCPACGFALQKIEQHLSDGDLAIDLAGVCRWRGEVVRLTRSELTIVHAMVAADGATMKREALENILGNEPTSNSTTVMVHRARKRFCEVDPTFSRIVTVHGLGWRWRGE